MATFSILAPQRQPGLLVGHKDSSLSWIKIGLQLQDITRKAQDLTGTRIHSGWLRVRLTRSFRIGKAAEGAFKAAAQARPDDSTAYLESRAIPPAWQGTFGGALRLVLPG